jgi:hypothetical protein
MQAGERQVSFGLHANRAENREPPIACQRRRLREQSRFPDSWLAPDDKRAAGVSCSVEERGQQLYLAGPTKQSPKVGGPDQHLNETLFHSI